MQKCLLTAILSGALLSSVLVAPAGAQESNGLCNGLEPTIVGTEGDDTIQGTFRDDVILALGGNDVIRGASGADVICGGAGDDQIFGDSQDDLLFGGAGNDVIYGASGADEIHGGDGDDTLYGESQDDLIFGDAGDDIIHGGSDDDEIRGGDGDDEIFGNSQADTLFGDAGDDRINGGSDEDVLDGGPGEDFLDGLWQTDSCLNGEGHASCEDIAESAPSPANGPILLSESEIAWIQGSSDWVNLLWTTDVELDNVAVRVVDASPGLDVEYPSATTRSLPSVDPALSVSEIDYTAVRFTAMTVGALDATVEISWDDEDGMRQSSAYPITLTNREYDGEDFAILTEAVTVGTDGDAPGANWIDLEYLGIAPTNTALAMIVDGEFPVHHPQETFTSLHHDEVLHAGETDVARVWFDPELVSQGTTTIVVAIEYVNTNGAPRSVSHEVQLEVR